jgi:hypothetical protein
VDPRQVRVGQLCSPRLTVLLTGRVRRIPDSLKPEESPVSGKLDVWMRQGGKTELSKTVLTSVCSDQSKRSRSANAGTRGAVEAPQSFVLFVVSQILKSGVSCRLWSGKDAEGPSADFGLFPPLACRGACMCGQGITYPAIRDQRS